MGLWDREFAAAATERDLNSLMAMLAARDEADVLMLRCQPTYWGDLQNPLRLLPHEPSTVHCPVRTIEPGATPVSLISYPLPPPAAAQGAQVAAACGLSLSHRV
jgi:hypothetical protein